MNKVIGVLVLILIGFSWVLPAQAWYYYPAYNYAYTYPYYSASSYYPTYYSPSYNYSVANSIIQQYVRPAYFTTACNYYYCYKYLTY